MKRLANPVRYLLGTLAVSSLAIAGYADATENYGAAVVSRESLLGKSAAQNASPIDNDLRACVDALQARKSAKARSEYAALIQSTRPKPLFVLKENDPDKIQVVIRLDSHDPETVKALVAAGVEIEIEAKHAPLIQCYAPISLLDKIAGMPHVRQISRPNYALATAGAITTQGDQAMGTTIVRSYPADAANNVSYNGNAVNVLVASDNLFTSGGSLGAGACNALQTVLDTERPVGLQNELPIGPPFNRCPNGPGGPPAVPASGFFGAIPIAPSTLSEHVMTTPFATTPEDAEFLFFPEGAAMLEVIHDVAPGANMRYIRGRTDLELITRRDTLDFLETPVDVVVDNLTFTGAGRYDGSSAVSRSARNFSLSRNIPFFVSAGGVTTPDPTGTTRRERFPMQINGNFNADPRDQRVKVHSWSQGSATSRDEALSVDAGFITDPTNPFSIFPIPLEITLVWDDLWDDVQPRSTLDFDLYLVPRSSLSIDQAVASSTRLQNGTGSNPVERLVYFPLDLTPLAVVMVNRNSGENVRTLFTLAIEDGQIPESKYLTHGVPFCNSDALDPVISVGDIDLIESNVDVAKDIMPGRTAGPTPTGDFVHWFEGQTYPTVVGYSQVNTYTTLNLSSTQSDQAFGGPSAATAHLGGFAAILRHRFPQMPARRFVQLFTDTNPQVAGGSVSPFLAKDITPQETLAYEHHPTYIRPNPFGIYDALSRGRIDAFDTGTAKQAVSLVELANDGSRQTNWEASGDRTYNAFDLPTYRVTDLGLEMTATSDFCYGTWESPVLEIQGPDDTTPRTTLRTDRVYVAEARVGSTGTDPLRVPDFRLRITTTAGDESAMNVIAGVSAGVNNAPTTIGGNVYRVYFRPSNEAVCQQGIRFYFDMLNFNPDDDQNVTLILRDFSVSELQLPTAVEAAP